MNNAGDHSAGLLDSIKGVTAFRRRLISLLAAAVTLVALLVYPAYAQSNDPPAEPTGLGASVASGIGVNLTWNDPEDDTITGYEVLRRDRAVDRQGVFHTIESDTGSADTAYTDATVAAGGEYVYRVKAISAHGVSVQSGYANAEVGGDYEPPTPESDPADLAPGDPPPEPQQAVTIGIPHFRCYRTVEETFATAESIVANNPTLARWVDVGDSWLKTEGRPGYDMMVLILTNTNIPGPKPKMFVTSAMHGRELPTAELMTRFAERLISNYEVVADDTWLLDHHEIHLMLQANPDGRKVAESGLYFRKNANENYCGRTSSQRGVDLNRNFDFRWGHRDAASLNIPCSEVYRGPSPASEPETQAIQSYIRSIFPDQRGPDIIDRASDNATGIYLDIHSSGQVIFYPEKFSEESQVPNGPQIRTLARKLARFTGYTPVGLTLSAGYSTSFGYGEMGLASFTYELGKRGGRIYML